MYKFIFAVTAAVLFFQNCGRVSIGRSVEEIITQEASTTPLIPTTALTPIDPYLQLNCKEEKHLAIWKDPDKTGVIESKNYLGAIYPYMGTKTAYENYNYYSASAHPYAGPVPKAYSMAVFFYADPQGDLYFNTFANVDDGGTSTLNTWNLNITTSNNFLLDNVILSDDDGELLLKKIDKVEMINNYEARFKYAKNTDGGVIGPFRGKKFQLNAEILDTGDIDNASFFSSDGSSFDLRSPASSGISEVSSFIIQYQQYYICPQD